MLEILLKIQSKIFSYTFSSCAFKNLDRSCLDAWWKLAKFNRQIEYFEY